MRNLKVKLMSVITILFMVLTLIGGSTINVFAQTNYDNTVYKLIGGISSNITVDDWAAMDLKKAGKIVPASYLTNLQKNLIVTNGVMAKPTDYERTVLGILGAGGDPTNFSSNNYNLIEKIYNNTGIVSQGINAYVYALIALDAANFTVPTNAVWNRQNLIQGILDKQNDGGWDYFGGTADPDMTAMTLSALAPYYNTNTDVKTAVDTAINRLSQLQTAKGGFSSWGTENANSVEMVIIALYDNGIDPTTDTRFKKNNKNPIDALLGYALSNNNAFGYTNNTTANAMATEQGLRALAAYKLFKAGQGSVYKNFTVN
ncbi:prenyltransferase/squalene oxidase repeat-containing protein [Clostridium sp. FP1]|uniref:prenyltransferase/squalene oxidase repeat-containing protein n=1 Tax=Clostridium sp. FP1 TaxID=2724076 RepID=UPI0013E90785|nr:prenyltransferase/squalene oxidase repeat-containing protein [Clostridium sp. FP1]MBZ9634846.1 terpene cyclase/mutase family protein [Clostridium sp. FP1]